MIPAPYFFHRRAHEFDVVLGGRYASDNNFGNRERAALATVAEMVSRFGGTIPDDARIGVVAESALREELAASAANVRVFRVGYGPRPEFIGADVLPSNGWTDVGDGSFSQSVVLPAASGGFVNTLEADGFMTLAASQAACAATPGTYFPSAHGGTITLYVNPSTGSPVSNGLTYEVTVRNAGIWLTGANCAVRGIRTRKSWKDSGSLILGKNAEIVDCQASEGGKHNMFFDNGRVHGCLLDEAAYSGSGNLLVAFTDLDGSEAVISDTEFLLSAENFDKAPQVTAFTCHSATTQVYANMTLRGGKATGFNTAFGGDDVTNYNVIGVEFIDCRTAVQPAGVVTNVLLDGPIWRNPSVPSGARILYKAGTTSVATIRNALTCCTSFSGSAHIDFVSVANATLEDSNLYFNGSGGWPLVCLVHNDGALACNRNTIHSVGGALHEKIRIGETGTVTYTGDNNHFVGSGLFRKDAVDNADLPAWQTASGQDANSDTVGDASGLCA